MRQLIEKVELHDTLNPKIWENDKLKTVGIIESAVVELKSLLEIAQKFTDGKADNNDLKEVDFCLSKMEEHVNKLNNLFVENKIEELINS